MLAYANNIEFIIENEYHIYYKLPSNYTKLKLLDINYNKTILFELENSELNPTEINKLSALIKLENILLDSNNMCCEFNFETIVDLQHLKYFHMKNNKFKYIYNTLKNNIIMTKLEEINLSYNHIEVIDVDIFKNTPNLKVINLSFNKITRIYGIKNIINVMPLIKTLTIDGNLFDCHYLNAILTYTHNSTTAIDVLPPYTFVEDCTDEYTAKTFKNTLCCANYTHTFLIPNKQWVFYNKPSNYANFKLHNELYQTEKFYFMNGNISVSEIVKLKKIKTLRSIKLTNNSMCCNFDFVWLNPNVKNISLKNNNLKSISNTIEFEPILLEILDLSYNKIENISIFTFEFVEFLQVIKLSFNKLIRIDDYKYTIKVLPYLEEALIDNNLIPCSEMETMLIYTNSVVKLLPRISYVSECTKNLQQIPWIVHNDTNTLCCIIPYTYYIPNKLEINLVEPSNITKLHMLPLNYYNNTHFVTIMNTNLNVKELKKLTVLRNVELVKLNNNSMCCTFDFKHFIGFNKLTSLHLNDNKFKTIKNNVGPYFFPRLEYVNLNRNQITSISINVFCKIPNLKHIGLSYNKLVKINGYSSTRALIPIVYKITIDGNPFSCNTLRDLLFYGNRVYPQIEWLPRDTYVNDCDTFQLAAVSLKTNFLCCINETEIETITRMSDEIKTEISTETIKEIISPITLSSTIEILDDEFYLNNSLNSIYYKQYSNYTKFKLHGVYTKTYGITLMHSKLKSEELDKLSYLHELYTIRLDSNKMCCEFDFRSLIGCKKLMYLFLDDNQFKVIKNSLSNDEYFYNLDKIDFSYNNIESINIEVFKNMPNLTYIGLAYNKISRIDDYYNARSILPLIQLIQIDGNLFKCNDLVNILLYGDRNITKLEWLPVISYLAECTEDMKTAVSLKTKSLCCISNNDITVVYNETTDTIETTTQNLNTQILTTQINTQNIGVQINTQNINIDHHNYNTFILNTILIILIVIFASSPFLHKLYKKYQIKRNVQNYKFAKINRHC